MKFQFTKAENRDSNSHRFNPVSFPSMADPMDAEQIAFRCKAEAIVVEAQTKLVFFAPKLLHIAFAPDQIAVEGFK